MKAEDLIVDKLYLVDGEVMKYLGVREHTKSYLFIPVVGDRSQWALNLYEVECVVKEAGEKTMILTRKPEEIRIRLSKEGLTDLLSSQGYDLADYELDKDIYNKNGFVFEFKLKQEVDNG